MTQFTGSASATVCTRDIMETISAEMLQKEGASLFDQMKNATLIAVCYPARSGAVVFHYLWRFPALSAVMRNQIVKPFLFPPLSLKQASSFKFPAWVLSGVFTW